MAILAGIDEAGYGPLLGPLVVTGVAFEVPDDALDDCLWERFQASVTRRVTKSDHRLPILDSKRLYKRGDGLGTLERTTLVMAGACDVAATTSRGLLHHVAPGVLDDLTEYPWYRDDDIDLPTENDPTSIALAVNAVKRDMAGNESRMIGIFSEVLLEGHFNRLVGTTRNKAVASLGLVWRIADRIRRAAGGQVIRLSIDRQGGRQRYGPALMTAFDQHHLEIAAESESRSAYRFDGGQGFELIEFLTKGEDARLPIALAGVFSKYVRELFMLSFNRFWAERVSGLKPTAGYYRDALRFLADIDPAVRRSGLSRSMLVRCR